MNLSQTISIIIVIGIIATKLLGRKHRYFTSGLILIVIGVLDMLHGLGRTDIDLASFPVAHFAVYVLVLFAGKDLVREGMKEHKGVIKRLSITVGIVLLTISTISTLSSLDLIDWALTYPRIVDNILYIVSGFLLWIGIFTLLRWHQTD